MLYQFGNGVSQDYTKAAFWYLKSAEQDNAVALCNLGDLYENGSGVPHNRRVAYALYNLASADGLLKGSIHRNRLAQRMSNGELNSGENLTRNMAKNKKNISSVITAFIASENYHKIESALKNKKESPSTKTNPKAANDIWPLRPAKQPGATTCNTRCINGSCWRTYDNGRHVHFTVSPSIDPFSGDISYKQPPC